MCCRRHSVTLWIEVANSFVVIDGAGEEKKKKKRWMRVNDRYERRRLGLYLELTIARQYDRI